MQDKEIKRNLGLFGATGVGVGAIVGGGILALAGVAFSITGPSALVAFAVNGVIALLTALSFAEMASTFPESGGTYTFSKKVLSVRSAFMVGWVVWFASIVAGVLYAVGFASFAIAIIDTLLSAAFGSSPKWISSSALVSFVAIAATAVYTFSLVHKAAGGGQWINVAKVVVFGILILGGMWVLAWQPAASFKIKLTPFFANGGMGLLQAMGFTFIALQGFDLIAAVGGEIKEPARNIPKSMLFSLMIALAIYIPFLFILSTVGVPSGETITALSNKSPETVVALAAQNYLGLFGYWLVMVAGVLSMLSALQANLYAASRVALAMGRDRTLSHLLEDVNPKSGTPKTAILATALIVVTIILIVSDVASAGAASSLIFLITFALAHLINILVRKRGTAKKDVFRTPFFPAIPVIGGLACLFLALFQGVAVPSAGLITLIWLAFGGMLYWMLFSKRAQVVDASAEAFDPELLKLRGKSPFVLVPIANPANAEAMIDVANAMAPRQIGRVLLLSVVSPEGDYGKYVKSAQDVLRRSLKASLSKGIAPEALTTIAPSPWPEIIRVSKLHRCESLLFGFSNFTDEIVHSALEEVIGRVDADVIVLRAPKGWSLTKVKKILVPVAGKGGHVELRARLLTSLLRSAPREITYMKLFAESTSNDTIAKAEKSLARFAREEIHQKAQILVDKQSDVADAIMQQAQKNDLVILGLQRLKGRQKSFGSITKQIARNTSCGIIMINKRR